MRVVLLMTDLQPGGTPLRIAALARGLRSVGADVVVGCLAAVGPVGDQLARDGLEVFGCDARDALDLGALRTLRHHLRRLRPDVLHATLVHANVAARLVGRKAARSVLTSTATIEIGHRWHLWIERLTAGLDAGHIVHSAALAEHVCAAFGRRRADVHVVPPLIWHVPRRIERAQARDHLGLPVHAPILLWAGRFDPVKRIERAVDALERLNPATHLLLAGDGPLRPQIERAVAARGLHERVRFTGWLDDLSAVMSAADVLVLCSRTEGVPNVVLQAMAFGLPVVAGALPTLRELAGDPPCLQLVPNPTGAALADAIRTLLADPQRVAKLTRQARQRAMPWTDAAAVARAHVRIYEAILHRIGRGP